MKVSWKSCLNSAFLIRGENESGDTVIEFYFQQFRDYIIAFKARHFNTMTDLKLLDEFNSRKVSWSSW